MSASFLCTRRGVLALAGSAEPKAACKVGHNLSLADGSREHVIQNLPAAAGGTPRRNPAAWRRGGFDSEDLKPGYGHLILHTYGVYDA